MLMVQWGGCPPGTGLELGFHRLGGMIGVITVGCQVGAARMRIFVISVTKKDTGKMSALCVERALSLVADL